MKNTKLLIAAELLIMALFFAETAGAIQCKRPPLHEALDALNSSFSVEVSTVTVESWDNSVPAPADDNIYYVFTPKRRVPKTGFIILPGGNCDPRSYAPAAHAIAAKGFLTFIIPMPSCVAIFGYTRAGKIIQDYAQIEKWAIGGHSVGGTAASIYAVETTTISGVVIWASLANTDPAKTLANSTIKVLSVYGSQDGRATPESVMENAEYLPTDTGFVEIKGGNHTQFGWIDPSPDPYLKDPDDKPATISIEQQQREIVRATANFLEQFNKNACPVISLFGSNDPRTMTIARFRNEILMKSLAGRSIIATYEKNGTTLVGIFEKHPVIKSSARKVLETLLPVIELIL